VLLFLNPNQSCDIIQVLSMFRKVLIAALVLIAAFGILLISVFRTASVKYQFSDTGKQVNARVLGETTEVIDYNLPYPGKVLPDSPLWSVKALRDRVWLWVTTNPTRKAELKLLFADKRLGSSKILFEKGKFEEGLTTLTKAEKYLEEVGWQEEENRKMGIETSGFLEILARASLKHYEVMQNILTIAPEAARPTIIQTQGYSKRVFENSRNALLEKGKSAPENPFAW